MHSDDISNSNKKISSKLKERIFNECLSLANTLLIKLYAKHLQESKSEQSLQIVYKNDILLVKTDLLIKNAGGEWEVWEEWDSALPFFPFLPYPQSRPATQDAIPARFMK